MGTGFMQHEHVRLAIAIGICALTGLAAPRTSQAQSLAVDSISKLNWERLPSLPNELGVAGPFVGVHNDTLIVAGGANFPQPVWKSKKRWVDEIYVLRATDGAEAWELAGRLKRSLAYGACVSTPAGIVCIGGSDEESLSQDCFLLAWDASTAAVVQKSLPSLPRPLAYGQACKIGDTIYVAGGQTDSTLDSAVDRIWSLECQFESGAISEVGEWVEHPQSPAPSRAFNLVVCQNNGFENCMYVIGGRRQAAETVEFLTDCWEYNPRTKHWRSRAALPQPMVAGAGIDFGQSHIFVLSGDTGELFTRTDALQDQHPGFPKVSFAYHTITDSWTELGATPANQVTTSAVHFGGAIVLPTGEVRPRVRSPEVWRITCPPVASTFSWIDYFVLSVYLLALLAIGVYFARVTRDTEAYFRGSGDIPWWAAGCSIFATMLSSLTFTGVPSKAYAQDWVYAVGNMMIPVVAIAAVYIALPFFRRIDATSAYEYLERRFHWSLRLFASASFAFFHVFRMAIVMSLTGLALAVATPLTPVQSVLLMGILSVAYCSIGGISAVIWTDTLQTFVLLGGALLAIVWMLSGTGASFGESLDLASRSGKLNFANWTLSPMATQLALWVVVVGGLGQNVASYTADQAVVQRYMTTKTQALAARSIWTNAILTIPSTLLFFGIGTSLFLFYRAHPDRLDPTINTDQVFPLFIAQELPNGVSGLIVAAILAAAQSTISTSMNSVASTLIADFVRPMTSSLSDLRLLRVAQLLTVLLGVVGTGLALFFVDASIRSLFDKFIAVIGLCMGVLGGLFVLGALFPKANAFGAWSGAIVGTAVMILVWQATTISSYLYTAVGIVSCVLVGAVVSHVGQSARH
jgi:solute:Na+ symporter, SSS family